VARERKADSIWERKTRGGDGGRRGRAETVAAAAGALAERRGPVFRQGCNERSGQVRSCKSQSVRFKNGSDRPEGWRVGFDRGLQRETVALTENEI
jgi:hypothetical protein